MAKEVKMEYGTSLHTVDEKNHIVTTEFWGKTHAEEAQTYQKMLTAKAPLHYFVYLPVEREV